MRVYREITSGTGVAARAREKEREREREREEESGIPRELPYFSGERVEEERGGAAVVPRLARAPIKSR